MQSCNHSPALENLLSLHEPLRSGRHPACRGGPASCRLHSLPYTPKCGFSRRPLRRAGSLSSTAGRMPAATVHRFIPRMGSGNPLRPREGRGEGKTALVSPGSTTQSSSLLPALPMNRQPHAYNLLLHMQQKVVSSGSGVQSAKLVLENSLSNLRGSRVEIN